MGPLLSGDLILILSKKPVENKLSGITGSVFSNNIFCDKVITDVISPGATMKTPNRLSSEQKHILQKTAVYVEKILHDDTTGHDYFHILRVRRMAEAIAKKEKADLFMVGMAALLHDVDDPKILGSAPGGRAEAFLKDLSLPGSFVEEVSEIIRNLSFSAQMSGASETSLEGRVVQDADRLDALGAIGIARTFAFGGSRHHPIFSGSTDDDSSIAHFYQKLLRLPALMNTKTAVRWARQRVRFMQRYLQIFHREWEGPRRDF
jgi:uncharacterized protein